VLFLDVWEIDRKMCGIIGVAGVEQAARSAYLGLYSLQHRGQESAGVVTVDGAGAAHSHRGMGLVSDVFSETVLGSLPGDVAIGHTRYSTAGSSVLANAQPIVAGYHEGPLALAHNGNLTNAEALRSDLVAKGSIFQTSSDSEVLIHLIARSEAREPEDQLLDALERVEGAYSLVVTIGRTLYAIVDPRGFRPLWLGKLGTGSVVASETCALDLIGATTVRELEPGEFLRIQGSPPEIDHLPSLPPKPHKRCIFELVYFSRPDSRIFGRSVDRVRRALGRELAKEHPASGADCVFSVPDSSNAMALGFAEQSGLKLEHALIRNHYVGRTFINPTQAARNAKVKIKFNPVREVLDGQKVVVVDDSLVRGTTSRELVQMIRQAGAKEVHFRVASAPITGPCYYGIDTPTKSELIASTHSLEEIRRHLGVETLGYLSLDGMKRAAGGDTTEFCDACFSGDYPTEISDDTQKARNATPLQLTVAV
jgi:amidophosphoribosyltransferase